MALATLARFGYTYPLMQVAALDSVDLEVDGGVLLITGDSGSGKSTLLRVFNGLVPHFHGGTVRGRAHVFGRDVVSTRTRDLARQVGFLFQDPELQAVYATVENDVAFGLENLGVPRSEMITRADAALEAAGIAALRIRAVTTLSGESSSLYRGRSPAGLPRSPNTE
jgi:energy-coupling factor transport system ATP-binding protein